MLSRYQISVVLTVLCPDDDEAAYHKSAIAAQLREEWPDADVHVGLMKWVPVKLAA